MRRFAAKLLGCLGLLGALLPGQELLWEVHDTSTWHTNIANRFGDLDHDGCDDVLVIAYVNYQTLAQYPAVRIFSGRNGTLLHEHHVPTAMLGLEGIGDFDSDGYPDFCVQYQYVSGPIYLEVWSPHSSQLLFSKTGPLCDDVAGFVDLTGEGDADLLVSNTHPVLTVIEALDHGGGLLYSINIRSMGFVARKLASVGDLDNDGRDDFVAGCNDFATQRGAVLLFSGRTGTLLRTHYGLYPHGILGEEVWAAGDMDGDGVTDYAAGSIQIPPLIMAWSGATGALIRQWTGTGTTMSGSIVCGRDVDLDGLDDVIVMAGIYPNVPNNTTLNGRVRTLSTRDGQDLVHVASQQWTSQFGDSKGDLGVQPNNPYPVIAVYDIPILPTSQRPRIRAWRLSPPGGRVIGTGASSTAIVPTIGVRRVDAAIGEDSRIVLGSAAPGALAFCAFAQASDVTGGGATVPLPLDPFGLAGCTLLVPPFIASPRLVGSSGMQRGYAAIDLAPGLVPAGGIQFAAQWIVLDPATLNYAVTARHEFRLQ